MSYRTYTTKALVCGAFDRHGADRTFLLYTREAGMLYAEAKSVRQERSRQRYALQEFSQIRVSLVRGKHTWKVGSVEALRNDYALACNRSARGSVALLYKLLRRYIQGEDPSVRLFDFCETALRVLVEDIPERKAVELYTQVVVMAELGYISEQALPAWFREENIKTVSGKMTESETKRLASLLEQASTHSQL